MKSTISLAFMIGCTAALAGCGGGGGSTGPDGGVPTSCDSGTQDDDGDGVCQPDCSQTACENGTCAIESGVAECSCEPGFAGAACDELAVPAASSVDFWMDAADPATTVTHAGLQTIETWTDKSANASVGTTTAPASSPTLVANTLGGLPVLEFDGDDDYVSFSNFSAATNTSYTIFLVARVAPGTAGTTYYGEGNSEVIEGSLSNSLAIFYHEPDASSSDVDIEAGDYGDAGWSPGEFHLLTVRHTPAEMSMWIDGNSMMSTPTQGPELITEVLDFAIGANTNGDNNFEGAIAEMIVVSDALDHSQRRPFEDYLAAKWFGAAFERNATAFGEASVWLDASREGALHTPSGDGVINWANGGVNGGFFDNGSMPASRPTRVEDGLGGHPVVRFDGGDALVQNSVELPEGGILAEYTIIAVVAPPATGSSQLLLRGNRSSNDLRSFEMTLDPDAETLDYLHRWPAGDTGGDSLSTAADTSAPMIIKVERSASPTYEFLVGALGDSAAGDAGTNINSTEHFHWALGGESLVAPGAGFNGDVAELIVIANRLGSAEEDALMAMLRAKWGL